MISKSEIKEINMKSLTKDIVLLFVLCMEYKLNFREVRKSYLKDSSTFWKQFNNLFPMMKATINKFSTLSKSSLLVYNTLIGASNYEVLNSKDKNWYEHIDYLLINKYEGRNYLLDQEKLESLIKDEGFSGVLELTFNDGILRKNQLLKDFVHYKNDIRSVKVGEDLFTKTSKYNYETGLGINDVVSNKVESLDEFTVFKDYVEIKDQRDLLELIDNNDTINTKKDLHVYIDLEIDFNIKCNKLIGFNNVNISCGNVNCTSIEDINKLECLSLNTLKDVNCNKIKMLKGEVKGNLVSMDIEYYSTLIVYNNIYYNTIKGARKNSTYLTLDGRCEWQPECR
jgi:hypothetical protein